MNKSFYRYILAFRGGSIKDEKSVFAEAMFKDLSFPKHENDFDTLSRYIEEKADHELQSVVFDELYKQYEERLN